MTQAERFIRNISEAQRRRIEHEREMALHEAKIDEIPINELPADVRRALVAWNKVQPVLKSSRQIIEKAGYQMPGCGEPTQELSLSYRRRDAAKSEIERAFRLRFARVEALQTAANIAILGLSKEEATATLKKLQVDLAAA